MLQQSTIIEYLDAIVTEGTFTQAAKSLYISQPYLSKAISTLEDEIQTKLVERNRTPMELTYAGERFLSHMKKMQSQYEDMLNELTMITNLKYGRLRIGVHPIMGSFLLPMVLPKFHQKYPGIVLKIIEQNPQETEEDLLNNKVDLYLGMMPIHNEQLSYTVLAEDRWCVIVPSTSSLYQPGLTKIEKFPYPLNMLKNEKYVLTPSQSGIRRQANEFLKSLDIKPDIVMESQNITTAAALSKKGMGLTFLPKSILHDNESMDSYNLFYIPTNVVRTRYFIAYSKDKTLSSVDIAMIDMAKEQMKEYNDSL